VLVFNILGSSDAAPSAPEPAQDSEDLIIRNLYEAYSTLTPENYQERYHDADKFKEDAFAAFRLGYLSLAQRARAEQIYWACCQRIQAIIQEQTYVPEYLSPLNHALSSIYYMNLSVFQSAPDCWAIDQLFPILPIHRLDQEPTQRATLADLTCDSDGKLDRFISLGDTKPMLELHPLQAGESYYLGMFLGGAYQEIMGNLHNLFGDTNAVHIHLTPQGYEIEHVVRGDTLGEVLGYVQYDSGAMVERIRRQSERAIQNGHMTLEESQELLQRYEASFRAYTYLSED